jgi:hypothetical protein
MADLSEYVRRAAIYSSTHVVVSRSCLNRAADSCTLARFAGAFATLSTILGRNWSKHSIYLQLYRCRQVFLSPGHGRNVQGKGDRLCGRSQAARNEIRGRR